MAKRKAPGFRAAAKEAWDKGLADLAAAGRQGHKEIGQALKAFPDSIGPVEEPGTMGNPVAREVYEARHPDQGYDAHLKQAAEAAKSEPTQEMELDRE